MPIDSDVIQAIIIQVGGFATMAVGGWFALRREMSKHAKEIQTHTEVTVKKLNGTLDYVINAMPVPAWVKIATEIQGETDFVMQSMNDACEDAFGITRAQWVGRTDIRAGIPFEKARIFRDRDLSILIGGESKVFVENTADGKKLRILKLRLKDATGKAVGIMGFGLDPCESADTCPLFSRLMIESNKRIDTVTP